jgi:hypothetical protein
VRKLAAVTEECGFSSKQVVQLLEWIGVASGDLPLDSAEGGDNLQPRSSQTLQEREIDRREHRDNPNVRNQPRPELVPKEQHVHAHHHDHHRHHVERDEYLSSHGLFLRLAAERVQDDDGGLPHELAHGPGTLGLSFPV